MNSVALFLVVSLRGLIELVLWVLLGRAVLRLLAGRRADENVILAFFDLLLRPPRAAMSSLLPGMQPLVRDSLLVALLVLIWLALAFCKTWLIH